MHAPFGRDVRLRVPEAKYYGEEAKVGAQSLSNLAPIPSQPAALEGLRDVNVWRYFFFRNRYATKVRIDIMQFLRVWATQKENRVEVLLYLLQTLAFSWSDSAEMPLKRTVVASDIVLASKITEQFGNWDVAWRNM